MAVRQGHQRAHHSEVRLSLEWSIICRLLLALWLEGVLTSLGHKPAEPAELHPHSFAHGRHKLCQRTTSLRLMHAVRTLPMLALLLLQSSSRQFEAFSTDECHQRHLCQLLIS